MRLGYQPALDGVRALAIAPVVALHAFGWPSEGSLGVDLFFVLSGFLITVLLLEEAASRGTFSLRRFWRRRAARLAPGLLLMLAVYVIVSRGSHLWAVAFGATYTANVATAISPTAIPWSLGHLWSLAQEEQFYLLWPMILLLLLRARPHLLQLVIAGLLVAVVIEKIALLASGAPWQRLYFGPDTHADPLLVGCFFGAVFAGSGIPWLIRRYGAIGPLVLCSLAAVLLLPPAVSPFRATSPLRVLFAVACGLLLLAAVDGGVTARCLTFRPLVFVGQISYSLYLWHVPILAALGATAYDNHVGRSTLAIAVTVVVASASFFLVERPLRRRWAQPRRTGAALAPPEPTMTAVAVAAEARFGYADR